MIDFKALANKLKGDLENLEVGYEIDIKSFKKDRSLTIVHHYDGYTLKEKGFKTEDFSFGHEERKECYKKTKQLMDYEFPRSNKIWYSISEIKNGK